MSIESDHLLGLHLKSMCGDCSLCEKDQEIKRLCRCNEQLSRSHAETVNDYMKTFAVLKVQRDEVREEVERLRNLIVVIERTLNPQFSVINFGYAMENK